MNKYYNKKNENRNIKLIQIIKIKNIIYYTI